MARRKNNNTRSPETPARSPVAARPNVTARPRSPAPANRGVVQVARARQQAIKALPDVLFDKGRPARSVSTSRPALQRLDQGDSPSRVQRPATSPRARPERSESRPLDLSPAKDDKCKPRPPSSRGSGGSRAFVPWCKK